MQDSQNNSQMQGYDNQLNNWTGEEQPNGEDREFIEEGQGESKVLWDVQDSFINEVEGLAQDSLLNEQEEKWARERHEAEDKMVKNVYKAYKQTKDREDFVHTLIRLHKKFLKTQPSSASAGGKPPTVPVQQPKLEQTFDPAKTEESSVKMPRDPLLMEIESLAKFGKFEPEAVEFCKQLCQQQDRKLLSIYSAYLRTLDREDFIHTVKRYFQQKRKQQ